MATQQLVIGALSEAERNLRRYIELSIELGIEAENADAYQELGRVLSYRGAWQEAETIHEKGIELARKESNQQIECVIMAYSAHRAFLMRNYSLAIEKGKIAKQLADIPFPGIGLLPRDQIRSAWILGAAYRANNELEKAEENQSKALNQCRQINLVEMEADILLDVARLSYAQNDFKDALAKAAEALSITERSGYVLQGADVNLFLAELAMSGHRSKVEGGLSDKDAAIFHAQEALRLAYCDGPPYYYKVAFEEAERMLKRLNDEG
ncbi:MAG: tetratricopeptide repeat protein [Anaerolineales bacterium]|nr:tetratricopeptide repeat protein [Anaerolineales bacterium]